MQTFKELQDEIGRRLGNIDLTTPGEAKRLESLKLALNAIQEECNKDASLRKLFLRKARFLTKPEVTTGTAAVTNGLKAITFSSPILTADFKDRLFICDDVTDVQYRFTSITSTMVAVLDSPYAGVTNATATFKVLKDRYYLRRDMLGIWNVWDRSNEQEIVLKNKTKISREEVDVGAEPENGALILSTETYYDVGIVVVTAGSRNITIAIGVFIPEMDGMAIRIDGDSVDYTFSYVSASTGTIDRVYEGTTNATAAYKMSPSGQWQIELYERPTAQILIDYDYLYRLPRLVNDNDISLITTLDDNVLWRGALWVMKDNDDVDPQGIDIARRQYRRAKYGMVIGVGRLMPAITLSEYRDI